MRIVIYVLIQQYMLSLMVWVDMVAGGNMQECFLRAILEALPTGTSEIMIHPGRDNALLQKQYGWPYHWEEEFQAVTSTEILNWIKENHVNLISFKELSHE